MKHTPGPWIVHDCNPNIVREESTDACVALMCDGGHCDEILIGDEEREANANLIAAAPDFLEALEKISNMDGLTADGSRIAFRMGAIATAAIAKAKGETK